MRPNESYVADRRRGGEDVSRREQGDNPPLCGRVWNNGNLLVVPEIIAPGYIYVDPMGREFRGPQGVTQVVIAQRARFPDLHVTIDEMVGEGSVLAVRSTWCGTFKGRKCEIPCAMFYRFEDGKEMEALEFINMLDLYQQMGMPPPGPGSETKK